jgi:MFS-type transporter involved in bile tolerance (Atg22 family)
MLFIRLISLLSGYFLSIVLASILTRNEQWILLIISSLIAFLESTGNFYYKTEKTKYSKILGLLISFNYLRLGIIYGFFMDGFKIGS